MQSRKQLTCTIVFGKRNQIVSLNRWWKLFIDEKNFLSSLYW